MRQVCMGAGARPCGRGRGGAKDGFRDQFNLNLLVGSDPAVSHRTSSMTLAWN